MWTYLAIFFSLSLLIGVYVRRMVLLRRRLANPEVEEPPEAPVEESVDEAVRPKKISADVLAEVEDLCKKGEAFLKQGKDEDAIKCFVQALALDELHDETQHKLAVLYLQKQMYSAAAALFRQLAQSTSDPVHYSHLGLALYQQSNYPEALEAYQKAVDLDDSRPQRFVSLAQVYKALGKLHHASVAIVKAMELDQENVDLIFLLADIQVQLGNIREGKELLAKLLSIEPAHPEGVALMAELQGVANS